VHEQYDPLTFALAKKIADGLFSFEDLIQLNRLISRETVVQTRQDDKLRVDTSLGYLESKIESMQTTADKKITRAKDFWKAIAVAMIALAGTVGSIAGACASAYSDARSDAIEPAARAEAKASRADNKIEAVTDEMDTRMKASESRHSVTEEKLVELSESMATTNSLLVGIAAKLEKDLR